jgi:molybdopterin molybdotransferase
MIPFDTAHELMQKTAALLGTERVPLRAARNRILAEVVISDVDSPPFAKAAMDGFACRRSDLTGELTVVEHIPAGAIGLRTIGPGECARIMTGAPVPAGADVVVKLEDTTEPAPGKVRAANPSSATNICLRGEDGRAGDIVLCRGQRLTPACLAVLATAGCARPLVARRPRVTVIATGNELVEPEVIPGPAAIRNSNGSQLCALLEDMQVAADYAGIVADSADALVSAIGAARREHDLVLLSGGVSAGDYDFVPEALERCGFRIAFTSVAMQPGKPMLFGQDGPVYCCCLPGNPVSTFVVFELLLKPFLYRLMGHTYQPRLVAALLEADIRGGRGGRQLTVPVVFPAPGRVAPVDYHGSAHIHALAGMDGLLTLPDGVAGFKAGTVVHVRLL